MNKKLKTEWSGFAVLLMFFAIFGTCVYLYAVNNTPIKKHYWEKTEAVMPYEKTYAGLGTYEVEHQSLNVDGVLYEVYYPVTSDTLYPAILTANREAISITKYQPWFERLASWGYVVIGADVADTWDGISLATQYQVLKDQYAALVDWSKIGVYGHGQGAIGAVNAVNQGLDVQVLYLTSLIDSELAAQRAWPYNISEVSVPVMMVSGNGESDELTSSVESMEANFERCTSNAVMARMDGLDYLDTLNESDGYMTAWFEGWLKATVNPEEMIQELYNNTRYIDVQSK